MENKYSIHIFTGHNQNLLSRVLLILSKRRLPVETLSSSESGINGIYRYDLTVRTTKEKVEKLVAQFEKQVDTLKVYYHENDDPAWKDVALFKLASYLSDESNVINN